MRRKIFKIISVNLWSRKINSRPYKKLSAFLITVFLFLNILAVFVSPAQATGASFYLAPSTGTFVIDSEFSIVVRMNTDGQVVNAAEGALSYDPKFLEVVNISRSGSVFALWPTEPVASAGNIRFAGGIPMPGYKGSDAYVLAIRFKAKALGVTQVNFTSGAVLANDGKGTNILASMGVASYTISPKIEAPKSEATTVDVEKLKEDKLNNLTQGDKKENIRSTSTEEYNLPKIESLTHPDQNVWSKNANIKFTWLLASGTTDVAFTFDNNPIGGVAPKSEGALNEKEYKDIEDGIWYFHLRFKDAKKWGTIADYRVMIDTRPPNPLEINMKEVGLGEWPDLQFSALDNASGLSGYEIFIGSLEHRSYKLSDQETMLKMSALGIGEHTAMVKAIDKAGNEIVSTLKFNINPIEAPTIDSYQKEMQSAEDFYLSGKSLPDAGVIVYLYQDEQLFSTSTVQSDANGAWFFVGAKKLNNGRYVAWTEAINANGVKSNPSEKVTFIVSPPVFAVLGNFVINYFTVFTSLIFLIVLIVFLIGKLRNRLKKETFEVEKISRQSLEDLEKFIDSEFVKLSKSEGKLNYANEKKKMKAGLRARVDAAEKKILKEVKDIEDILK
jgi:hypothetical protein